MISYLNLFRMIPVLFCEELLVPCPRGLLFTPKETTLLLEGEEVKGEDYQSILDCFDVFTYLSDLVFVPRHITVAYQVENTPQETSPKTSYVRFGFSTCNLVDKFDENIGRGIAKNRLLGSDSVLLKIVVSEDNKTVTYSTPKVVVIEKINPTDSSKVERVVERILQGEYISVAVLEHYAACYSENIEPAYLRSIDKLRLISEEESLGTLC